MFFKNFKKAESVKNISTHKELESVLTYASRELPPLVVTTLDTEQFDATREIVSNNIGKDCIYKCTNGAINLKHFCKVTFVEKDVAD